MNSNQFNTANYENELEIKRQKLKDLFKDHTDLEIEVFASAPSHYRMRSEFRVWHDGEDLYYYMFDKVGTEKFENIGSLDYAYFALSLIENLSEIDINYQSYNYHLTRSEANEFVKAEIKDYGNRTI